MTNQEIYVINSLSGKPLELVAQITAIVPDLIQAVEESGWIKIDDEHQPPLRIQTTCSMSCTTIPHRSIAHVARSAMTA